MDAIRVCPACKSPIARPIDEPRHVHDDIAIEALLDEFQRLRGTLERERSAAATSTLLVDESGACVVCGSPGADGSNARLVTDADLITSLSQALVELRTAVARVRGLHLTPEDAQTRS